jgi:peptidoglycan hydrolase-like protein with peptidoglycan-binding domain
MKFWITSIALLLCCSGALVHAQDTSTSQDKSSATASTTNQPTGTQVVGHHRDTVVKPKTKPVNIDANVVKAAQNELRNRGYSPGPIDGIAGPKTSAAVKNFQSKEGITATGKLDSDTLAKLNVGGTNIVGSAPADLGRGGKAFGHDIKEGHPVDAGKAMAEGSESFGKKVAKGTKSVVVGGAEKAGKGISSVGNKVEDKTQGQSSNSGQEKNSGQPSSQPQ